MKSFNKLLLCLTLVSAMFITGCKKGSCKTSCGPKKQTSAKVEPTKKVVKNKKAKSPKKMAKKNSKCKTRTCKKSNGKTTQKVEKRAATVVDSLDL